MNDLPPMMATRPSRVPRALQAVFLASNRGKEVNKPPVEAFKEFRRIAFFQRTVKSLTDKKQSLSKRGGSSGLFFRRKKRRDSIKSQVTDANCDDESCTLASSSPSSLTKSGSRHVLREVVIDTSKVVHAPQAAPAVSPQEYLDSIMKSRGYPTRRYKALDTGYRNKSTPLQLASYDVYLINLVRQGDTKTFRAIFQSGISSNPCNANGESLLHTVCRRGNPKFLRIMLEEAKSTVQVADDFGRTPLHDCLWSAEPCFDKVKLLLDQDVYLMQLADARGALPLSYTRQEHWGIWNQFLDDIKDCYWPPPRSASISHNEPPLTLLQPNSQGVKDPANALPPCIAAMVAGGRLSPEEGVFLRDSNLKRDNANKKNDTTNNNKNDDEDEEDDSDDEDTSSEESSFDSDSDDDEDDDDSSSSFDEEEMSDLIAMCKTTVCKAKQKIIC
jgi:Ankyrin repeats (3 copies)